MWRIEFSANRFLPVLPESCQVNPGAYGFELALWLAHRLMEKGMVTSYPQCEDWGWFIEHTDADETEMMIGCGSMADEGEGHAQKAINWSIFIKPHTSLVERFKGVTHREKVQGIGDAIVELLRAEGLSPVQQQA